MTHSTVTKTRRSKTSARANATGPAHRSQARGGDGVPAPEGPAPFRTLGVVAAEVLLCEASTNAGAREVGEAVPAAGSPSGLLTRSAWEAELTGAYGQLPDWVRSEAECERQFARWVQAEAKLLASRLERMLRAEAEPSLSRQVRDVAAALWADADWARRRLDGSMDDGF